MIPLPTRRFLALVAGAAALHLAGLLPALVVDALLLGAFLLDLALTPRPGELLVERSLPARVPLGATLEATLTLRNLSDRPLRVQLTDDLLPPLARIGEETLSAEIPARGEARLHYQARAERRGEATIGAIHLRLLGPLGLAWTRRRERREERVLVQPGMAEVRRLRLLGLRHRLRDAGVRNVRLRGEMGAFESLREYVPGDDPRTVDWKATARSSTVMVRQFEAERSQQVLLAIDAGRLMTERVGERERMDHALSAALVLADVASLSGDRVGVMVFSDRVHYYLPPARLSLSRISEVLSRVEPRLVESDYPGAFAYLARQLRRRSLVVLFTDVIDAGASSALLAHVTRAAHRHLPLVLAMRNTALEADATVPVESEGGAFRRAAEEELLQARAAALAVIKRAGVLVADVRPQDAAPAAVTRYLEVKARRLL